MSLMKRDGSAERRLGAHDEAGSNASPGDHAPAGDGTSVVIDLVMDGLRDSASPAMVVDGQDRVRLWNAGLERLTGRPAASVIGLRCHEALAGDDIYGNPYCQAACPIKRLRVDGRRVQPFVLTVARAGGGAVRLRIVVDTVSGPPPGASYLVYRMALVSSDDPGVDALRAPALDVTSPPDPRTPGAPRLRSGGAGATYGLTAREQEILVLLAEGRSNPEIGAALGISPFTARNHVQNLLAKLGVHTRAEAVAHAFGCGLLTAQADDPRQAPVPKPSGPTRR